MKQKMFLPFLLMLFSALNPFIDSIAQLSISGPTCVTAGTTYLYTIEGKWDSTSKVQLCVTGGVLTESGKNCVTGTEISYAKIDWNDNVRSGTITFTSRHGNASLDVKIISPFKPGFVDTLIKVQVIDSLSIPAAIACSAATGGSCSPSFFYQWQQSPDDMNWTDIKGATEQNLRFKSSLTQNMFYRRKVTEKSNAIIDYSNDAVIVIK